jgi:GcrA cell cycle regulator
MEWPDATIIRLRKLWGEGHSTAEIGRQIGVSKNAVVGKAHRLDLPARQSPIVRDPSIPPRQYPARRTYGPTLAPLASVGNPIVLPTVDVLREPSHAPPRPAPARPAPVVSPMPPPVARPQGRVVTCCWPIGEPGTRSFRFCGTSSHPGKLYCSDHCKMAYGKVRGRHEDVAAI